jgi:hypothetical protein
MDVSKGLRGQLGSGGFTNIFALVLTIIFTVNLVIPTIVNANISGLSSSDQTVFKSIATIVVVGVIAFAARSFGLISSKIKRFSNR